MAIGRYPKNTITTGNQLPQEWTENYIKVISDAYRDRSIKDKRFFDAHGRIYDDETVIVTSYIHENDYSIAPISVFISFDTAKNSASYEKYLQGVIQLTSLIFDDIFAKDDWNDYLPNWTENKVESMDLFYRITRENLSLTIQAEELLKEN